MIVYTFEGDMKSVDIEKKNNPRYECLNKSWHRFYIAGDPDQFVSNIFVENNPDVGVPSSTEGKKVVHVEDMLITFEMIFHKFKKGCFLQFRGKEMKTFLPFSKINYTNNWSHNIEIDPKFGAHCNNFTKFKRMLESINQGTKYENYGTNFHRNMEEWYGNNGIFRFEYPLNEYDSGYPMLYDMFQCYTNEKLLNKEYRFDFFLNKRDNPLLRKDGTEAYHHFFQGTVPMEDKFKDKRDTMLPILSMNSGPDYEDYKIPTWECWRFFEYTRNKKIFLEKKNKEFKTFPHPNDFNLEFDSKQPIAVFRGTSTGIGTFIHNNIRMFVCHTSTKKENMDFKDGLPYLDAKLTDFNKRPKKIVNDNFVRTVDVKKHQYLLGNHLSYIEQSQYKYILHLPGHSCAYRLTIEMFFGSVILYFPHATSMWFFDMLEPWVHYIPMTNFDEKHLFETIQWCKENNDTCKQIAWNARKFAETYLNSNYALEYLDDLISKLASKYSIHYVNQKSILENNIIQKCNLALKTFQNSLFDDIYEKYWIPDFYFFQSFLYYLQRQNSLETFLVHSCRQQQIIKKKKTFIDFHMYRGIEFISKHIHHEFKRDDLQQLLVGYTVINKLHTIFPDHFVYTLFHEIGQEETKIFLEYKPHPTLFDFIQKKKIDLDDLFLIWLETCCILTIAQNLFGFIHGDLMSWNILIQELPEKKYIFFEELNIGFHRKFIPCLIDYGESHIVLDNISYYNSIPFKLCMISDVVFMVLKTIENHLSVLHPDFLNLSPSTPLHKKKQILLHHHNIVGKIYQILQYLLPKSNFSKEKSYTILNCSTETIQNINNDLWNIRNFCRKMSKYSKLLENTEHYAPVTPKEFIFFLLATNCIPKKSILTKFISSSRLYLPIISIPNYNFFMKNKIWEKIIKIHHNNIIHQNDIGYFENIIKKILRHYKQMLLSIQSKNTFQKYQNQVYYHHIQNYKEQIEALISVMNEHFNSKLQNLDSDAFDFHLEPILYQQEFDSWWKQLSCQSLQPIYFTNNYDYHQLQFSSEYKYLVDLVMFSKTFSFKEKSFFHYRTFQK